MKLGEKVVPIRLIVPTTLMQSAKHPRMKKQIKSRFTFQRGAPGVKKHKVVPPNCYFCYRVCSVCYMFFRWVNPAQKPALIQTSVKPAAERQGTSRKHHHLFWFERSGKWNYGECVHNKRIPPFVTWSWTSTPCLPYPWGRQPSCG